MRRGATLVFFLALVLLSGCATLVGAAVGGAVNGRKGARRGAQAGAAVDTAVAQSIANSASNDRAQRRSRRRARRARRRGRSSSVTVGTFECVESGNPPVEIRARYRTDALLICEEEIGPECSCTRLAP